MCFCLSFYFASCQFHTCYICCSIWILLLFVGKRNKLTWLVSLAMCCQSFPWFVLDFSLSIFSLSTLSFFPSPVHSFLPQTSGHFTVSWSKINRRQQLAAILQQRLSFSSLWTPLMFYNKILMSGNLLYWYRFGSDSAGKGGRKENEGGWDTKTGAWGVGEARFVFWQRLITEESKETQGSFNGGKKDFKLLLFFFPFILSFMRGGKKRRMKHCLT